MWRNRSKGRCPARQSAGLLCTRTREQTWRSSFEELSTRLCFDDDLLTATVRRESSRGQLTRTGSRSTD